MMSSDDNCRLAFSYSMFGKDMGGLKVLVRTSEGTELVWSRFGDRGSAWQDASIVLNTTDVFQVVLRADFSQPGMLTDMAIDDISFEPCLGMSSGLDLSC